MGEWLDILFITIQSLAFSSLSPPRFLGQPAAKILYAYNPSRESEVVVNSVFTAARHFHVPPVHCRVSVDQLLEAKLWRAASCSCFLWPAVFFYFLLPVSPFSATQALSFCVFALAFIFSVVQIHNFVVVDIQVERKACIFNMTFS